MLDRPNSAGQRESEENVTVNAYHQTLNKNAFGHS